MSQGIGGVGGSGSVSGVGSLGTCTSVNFIFAKLQMELAASASSERGGKWYGRRAKKHQWSHRDR